MSGGCARCFGTSSRPSAWPWQLLSTTVQARKEEEKKAKKVDRGEQGDVGGAAAASSAKTLLAAPPPPLEGGGRGRRGGGEPGTGLGSWSAAPHDGSSILSSVVCVSVSGYCLRSTFVDSSGRRFPDFSRIQLRLVRQWMHVWRWFGVLQPLVSDSHLFDAGFCLRSTVASIILGDHFQMVPYSALSGSTVDTYFCQSTGLPGLYAFSA